MAISDHVKVISERDSVCKSVTLCLPRADLGRSLGITLSDKGGRCPPRADFGRTVVMSPAAVSVYTGLDRPMADFGRC